MVALASFLTTALVITRLMSTVRKSFEEIQRSEAMLRERADLLDLTHDTVFVRDMNEVITYWNRGAEELYGWSRQEALGKTTHELLHTAFPAPLEEITAVLLRTDRWEGELVHTRRDGARVTVASRWSVQRDDQGRPIATLETNSDITERKRAEEAVRKAQAELAHVARVTTLGEMAASIAHEVDQPLSGVVINANACLRFLTGAPPNLDEVRDGLQAIARDGRRASDVIARIRALARRTATEKEPLDINDVIREVVALAEGRGAAGRRSTAPDRARRGSPASARRPGSTAAGGAQLAPERIGSHARASSAGRANWSSAPNGRRPIASVSTCGTRGSGIDPELAKRMFEAFYTSKPGGLGMGLSISRSIVEQHGGRLWAVPNDGPGTTFHFTV